MLPLPQFNDDSQCPRLYSADYWYGCGWNDLATAWNKVSRGKFSLIRRMGLSNTIQELCEYPDKMGHGYSMGNEWYLMGIETHYLHEIHGNRLPDALTRYEFYLPLVPWKNHDNGWAHVCKLCKTGLSVMLTCTGGVCFDMVFCSEACASRMLERRVREDSDLPALQLAGSKVELDGRILSDIVSDIRSLPRIKVIDIPPDYPE